MKGKTRSKAARTWLVVLLSLTGLCLLLSGISALSNLGLPQSDVSDRLAAIDHARLSEAWHLKAALGEQVWPGWGSTRVPVILSNHAYEFLIGYPVPPPADWSPVPGDSFAGDVYYRRPAVDPQNFAVPVGDLWAASMATKTKTDVFLIEAFRELFPPPVRQVFPYRLLIQPTETQIGGVLHEDFHVFQQQAAPERLAMAEAIHRLGDEYALEAAVFETEFKQEAGLLAQALEAETDADRVDLVREFLAVRDARRQTYRLDADLVAYERWLEWEEGTAKYVEVASLRQAFLEASYAPLSGMDGDPDFQAYRGFERRWDQEMTQLRNPNGSLETRFYMTGMAESFLLDRLLPGWKDRVLVEEVFLEDLLRQAVEGN